MRRLDSDPSALSGERDALWRAGAVFLLAVLAVALAVYGWRGWYSRYVTDDFCTAAQIRDWGFGKAMRFHRESWSGRFSYFPIKQGLESIGPITAQFTPAALIALLAAAAACTVRRLTEAGSHLLAFTAGLAVAFAVVDSSPSLRNVGGSLYWETGAITYTLPPVLFVTWLGLFASPARLRLACVTSAVLMLIAGGLNETWMAAQGVLTGGALLLCLAKRARAQTWVAGCGVAGTLVALAIVATAPGNSLRLQEQASALSLTDGLTRTLIYTNGFLGSYFFVTLGSLLPMLVVAVWIGARSRAVRPGVAAGCAAIAIAAYVISFFPAAWLLRTGPPERTLDVPNQLLIGAAFAGALTAGAAWRIRGRFAAALILVVAIVPLLALRTNLRTMPEARQNAARMDALDRELRQQRGRHATVHAPWLLRQGIASTDPAHYANGCMSHYYQLQSLRVLP